MGQTAFLGDSTFGFYTKKYGDNSVSKLNNKILAYIREIYGPHGFIYPSRGDDKFSMPYEVVITKPTGDIILKNEVISKMVNNYTVFRAYIRENRITNDVDFYNSIEEDFHDVYHYDGVFFKRFTLPIIMNTIKKGDSGEKRATGAFQRYAKRQGFNIRLLTPTISEDISGIDTKFEYRGKIYTVQIKPFSYYREESSNTFIKSTGSLSIITDYLVLYNQYNRFIICRNPKDKKILISGDYFVVSNDLVTII